MAGPLLFFGHDDVGCVWAAPWVVDFGAVDQEHHVGVACRGAHRRAEHDRCHMMPQCGGPCEIQSEYRLSHARPSRDEGKLSGPQALDGRVDVTESGGNAVPLSLLDLVDPLEQIVHQRADGFASGNIEGRRPSHAAGARVRIMLRIPGGIPSHAGPGIHTGLGVGARMGVWGLVDVRHGYNIGMRFPDRYISTGIERAAGSSPWQKAYSCHVRGLPEKNIRRPPR